MLTRILFVFLKRYSRFDTYGHNYRTIYLFIFIYVVVVCNMSTNIMLVVTKFIACMKKKKLHKIIDLYKKKYNCYSLVSS